MFLRHIKRIVPVAIAGTLAITLAGCGGDSPAASSGGEASDVDPTTCGPAGDITVLTWRTDQIEDGTFDDYVASFKEKYPEIGNVDVQGITDYEGEVKTRMSTSDYGDVLGIPNSVRPDQFSQFFEPLGQKDEMEETYRWLNDKSYEGVTYGIPTMGNVMGVVYNVPAFEEAGIQEFAATPDEFIEQMKTLKEKNPEIDPVYTNYKDGWPLTAWSSYAGTVTGPDATNQMAQSDSPWTEESDFGVIDGLLYDLVNKKLTEADPTTTNWEGSKQMLATGEIGAMFLGSWAIPQMQAAAVAAGGSADDIGYMPFPYQQDGKFYAVAGGDYNLAINVNSSNKCAARAWIDWFNSESGYSESQVGLSPRIDGTVPAALVPFVESVELLTMNPAPEGKEGLFAAIDKESEILTTGPDYRMKLVDDARSGARDKQQIFDDLNAAWAKGRAAVGDGS